VVKGFYEKLLNIVIIISLLLAVFVVADYAANNITCNSTDSIKVNDTNQVFLLNESEANLTVKNTDKVHTVPSNEKELPTISMWAKPSVRCGYAYRWYYRTFIDYCPNCHHYNALLKNPKGVPENEYSCKFCDSDFDGVVGKEKYSWSNVYLRRA
jgi:uncharacterized protein YcfL